MKRPVKSRERDPARPASRFRWMCRFFRLNPEGVEMKAAWESSEFVDAQYTDWTSALK